MTTTLVTLLMPVWNSNTRVSSKTDFGTLTLALESIANQTFTKFEVHILDNISTDGTYEFLKNWCQFDERFKITIDTERRLPEAAIQLLAEGAKSEYVAIVNDDDLWDPEYLKRMLQQFEMNKDIDLVFSNARSIDLEGRLGRELVNKEFLSALSSSMSTEEAVQVYFFYRSVIPTMFGLFKRESFMNSLPMSSFDALGANTDNRFMLQFLSKGFQMKYLDEVLFYYRSRPRKITGFELDEASTANQAMINLIKRYIQHQLEFYLFAAGLVDDKRFNRIEFITFLISTLSHIEDLLKWILQDYANTKQLESIVKRFLQILGEKKLSLTNDSAVIRVSQRDYANSSALVNFPELRSNLAIPYLSALRELVDLHTQESSSPEQIRELSEVYSRVLQLATSFKGIPDHAPTKSVNSLVCVYTCSFNLDRFVEYTMDSISSQKHVVIEHLVVDGGSTDQSLSTLSRYRNAKIVSTSDEGFIDGAWKAIASTKADYITQCCVSDGYANINWLATALAELEEHPEVSLIWGFPRYLTEDGIPGAISYEFLHWKDIPQEEDMYLYWMKTGFFFPEGNFVCRTNVYKDCLPRFDECEGIEPFLEFTNQFHTKGYLSRGLPIVANYGRQHHAQLSSIQENSGELHKMRNHFEKGIKAERDRIKKARAKVFMNPQKDVVKIVPIRRDSTRHAIKPIVRAFSSRVFHMLPKSVQIEIKKTLGR